MFNDNICIMNNIAIVQSQGVFGELPPVITVNDLSKSSLLPSNCYSGHGSRAETRMLNWMRYIVPEQSPLLIARMNEISCRHRYSLLFSEGEI